VLYHARVSCTCNRICGYHINPIISTTKCPKPLKPTLFWRILKDFENF